MLCFFSIFDIDASVCHLKTVLLLINKMCECALVCLLFSMALSSLCHSDDADSAVVMTFPHCHANISQVPLASSVPVTYNQHHSLATELLSESDQLRHKDQSRESTMNIRGQAVNTA